MIRLFLDPLYTNPGSTGRQQRTEQVMSPLFGRRVTKLLHDLLSANPGSTGRRRETEQIMSPLFRTRYVDPNSADNDGRTPLSWAAGNGHAGAVKILLGREDLSPDRPDNHGQTPLWWAALNGHTRVVKLLLIREDVNPARLDNYGRTPLTLASLYRNLGAEELLRAQGLPASNKTNIQRRYHSID